MESKSGKVGSKSTERLKDLPIDSPEMPFSSPKRKLLEAKEKDAHFERESKAIEATRITKELSKQFVSDTITNVLDSLPSFHDVKSFHK